MGPRAVAGSWIPKLRKGGELDNYAICISMIENAVRSGGITLFLMARCLVTQHSVRDGLFLKSSKARQGDVGFKDGSTIAR
jgi:hypothetical protein